MLEDFDSQLNLVQENKDKSSPSKATPARLKLVVSNPVPIQVQESPPSFQPIPSLAGFTAETQNRGPHLYEMMIQDPSHHLSCSLVLEVEESRDETESGTVICHFPAVSGESLKDLVEEDETLYGILMIQFQMKILEQLFLFCITHHTSRLIIYTDEIHAEELGIYWDFLIYEIQDLAPEGEKTEMIIPVNQETFNRWLDFMDETNLRFRQELWREQRMNPVIRYYLKYHPLG